MTIAYLKVVDVSASNSDTAKGKIVNAAITKQSCPKYFAKTEKRTA